MIDGRAVIGPVRPRSGPLAASPSVGDRIYPLTLPQGAILPAVAYQLVGGEGPLHSHADARGGDSAHHPTFERSRIQFGCWAGSARDADVLAAEVAAAVDGFTGSRGDVPIASALVDISLDDWRPDVRGVPADHRRARAVDRRRRWIVTRRSRRVRPAPD